MPRASRSPGAVTFVLDPRTSRPLHLKLYEAIREAILSRRLRPGRQVPSSRALAEQMNLSRKTVARAFEQLLAEGYLVTRKGAGTFVPDALPEASLSVPRKSRSRGQMPAEVKLSRRAQLILSQPPPYGPKETSTGLAFQIGSPAIDAFPEEIWGRLLQRRWARSSLALLRHRDPRGYPPLRAEIAAYLASARGVRCSEEQIIIVAGSQQAIRIIAEVLIDPGDEVWIEDPGYVAGRNGLLASGAKVVPVPVDGEGLVVELGRKRAPRAKLALVTPSNQLPLGVTLSLQRRMELLAWARVAESWVVEDDYDSEFRYVGRPLTSLQGLDEAERVIYTGTFSKVLANALRLGYVVAPRPLIEPLVAAKELADMRSPVLEQAALADFMSQGHFARHIRRMRRLYLSRQELLLEEARKRLGGRLRLEPAPAGMHLLGWLPPGQVASEVARRGRTAGLRLFPLSDYRVESTGPEALLLGYAGVHEREIVEGVRTLATVLR